jgi:hypothetical protein
MRYKGKRYKGLGAYKRLLRKADRQRIRLALCKIVPDERRAFERPKYNPWSWD